MYYRPFLVEGEASSSMPGIDDCVANSLSPTPPIETPREYVVRCFESGGTDRSKLEDREIILSRNSDAIAKWLDRQFEDRAKPMKAINQRTGQTSIISFVRTLGTRRQNNSTFQTRQQEARRAALLTNSNTVDGDQSTEESPD